jgi:hypothetical protein
MRGSNRYQQPSTISGEAQPGQHVINTPLDEVPALRARAPDVQASLTVLGRGRFSSPQGGLDLRGVDLRCANLGVAHLEKAVLYEANLAGAHLYEANLAGAMLFGANLTKANLYRAKLRGDLIRANLSGANLRAANLAEAELSYADLTEAIADRHTTWPLGSPPVGVIIDDTVEDWTEYVAPESLEGDSE